MVENEKAAKDWNPPIAECLASSKLKADDLLTMIGDRASEQCIHDLVGKALVAEHHVHLSR